jgi:iron-sulfur cluster insertion protein
MNVETLDASGVRLTERAARQIAHILKDEPRSSHLRVTVLGGGCSGFQYDFKLDDSKSEDDLIVAEGGAVVAIDPVSLDFLKGSEIDYVDEMIGASFKIKNPNATASCGCGTSFSI